MAFQSVAGTYLLQVVHSEHSVCAGASIGNFVEHSCRAAARM